jgi:hypothetical protein
MTKKVLNNLIKLDMKDVKFGKDFFKNNQKAIYIETSDDPNQQKITIDKTSCYFGGYRYWFICPGYERGVDCNSRVRILYRDDKKWGCRKCMNLTYRSQNLSGLDKLLGVEINLSEIKKKTYKGKLTRKYRRYLNKEYKSIGIINQATINLSKKVKKKMEKITKN